ncbi:hypothetical protein GGR58DRAFT_475059 [Xylaria digitata]|nr:hypothetical protein GGR58DRAFT_475059 [Xylaria digitata]
MDHGTLFRTDKIYLLFGVTGKLGWSLCKRMIAHGARNFSLPSRRPKVTQHFISLRVADRATVKPV